MKYEIDSNPALPYLKITLTGALDISALERCYQEFLGSPNWRPGTHILWDVRNCSLKELHTEDMHRIADMTLLYRQQRGQGKAAWVVSRELDFGISRMFDALNEGHVVFLFKVFQTIAEAEGWLTAKD